MSAMTDKQTSSDVAHEAEDLRANLAHTLDQLRNNLKPENVIEEVVGHARVGANSIADGLYALARENPFPALLIGAGCAMVLGLGSPMAFRKKSVLDLRAADASAADASAADASDGLARRSDALGHPRTGRLWAGEEPTRRKTTSTPLGSSKGYRGGARRGDGRLVQPIDDSSPTTGQDSMTRSSESFGRQGGKASRLSGILHEQPLIIAALGVAVGAAIGAALPITKVEDDWMGDASSSLRHSARDAAQAEMDELRAVAMRTAENLKQTVADHGLSSENLRDLVRDAGDNARSAIHDVGASSDHYRSA